LSFSTCSQSSRCSLCESPDASNCQRTSLIAGLGASHPSNRNTGACWGPRAGWTVDFLLNRLYCIVTTSWQFNTSIYFEKYSRSYCSNKCIDPSTRAHTSSRFAQGDKEWRKSLPFGDQSPQHIDRRFLGRDHGVFRDQECLFQRILARQDGVTHHVGIDHPA
jgi:hypothetical protein